EAQDVWLPTKHVPIVCPVVVGTSLPGTKKLHGAGAALGEGFEPSSPSAARALQWMATPAIVYHVLTAGNSV
ncbi:MAG: hypothetical protein M3R24_24480, partial [Chloroflexota bacterium]|nr:hypothetical protein [Chloroflexota bacterium]